MAEVDVAGARSKVRIVRRTTVRQPHVHEISAEVCMSEGCGAGVQTGLIITLWTLVLDRRLPCGFSNEGSYSGFCKRFRTVE